MKLQIGIIGYKNHALRLIQLVSQHKNCEIKFIYHPTKKIDHPKATNKLEDLHQSDAVIIASPNQTHFDYIVHFLKNYKGYIFCEKPPVNKLVDLQKLSKISLANKKRIYFNYNFRFGLLSNVLNDPSYLKKLGDIHHLEIITTHGLAFKKDYVNSWRADGKNNLHAITETVAIHYIDLLRLNFGKINSYFYNPKIIAKTGTAYDTVQIALNFNKVSASIFASYAAPYTNEISVIGTKGCLRISEGQLALYAPRDTFDANGFFKVPPLAKKSIINNKKEYENSLKKSFDFFITHVQRKKEIDVKYFEASLASNKFLLEIQTKQTQSSQKF